MLVMIELQRRATTPNDSKLTEEGSELQSTSAQTLSHSEQPTVNLKNKFELLKRISDNSSQL